MNPGGHFAVVVVVTTVLAVGERSQHKGAKLRELENALQPLAFARRRGECGGGNCLSL